MDGKSCPIQPPEQAEVVIVALHPEKKADNYQEAMAMAKDVAANRFEDYMLMSWYDRDRDFESPPNTTECGGDCSKDGYIHYALNHGAKLKVDVEDGRFVFFFTPVEW